VIRSDVIRSDVIRSDVIRSDVIRSRRNRRQAAIVDPIRLSRSSDDLALFQQSKFRSSG